MFNCRALRSPAFSVRMDDIPLSLERVVQPQSDLQERSPWLDRMLRGSDLFRAEVRTPEVGGNLKSTGSCPLSPSQTRESAIGRMATKSTVICVGQQVNGGGRATMVCGAGFLAPMSPSLSPFQTAKACSSPHSLLQSCCGCRVASQQLPQPAFSPSLSLFCTITCLPTQILRLAG